MTPTTYPVNLALPLADGGQLVVFVSFPSSDLVHHEISGREVVRFDAAGRARWQIDPEPGTTEGRSHAFDPAIPTVEPFVNVWEALGNHYASRWNGDTFLIAMESGRATYSGWART